MTSPADKLLGARLKVERAKEHIVDLGAAIRTFHESDPYAIRTKRDAQTGRLLYSITQLTPPPPVVSVRAGDAIQNLRSALDYLAAQLVLAGTGGTANIERTYFPIAENASKYKSGLKNKVAGMRQDAIDAITALEPYGGGKGHQFWTLHKFNNIDKHRLLLSVGVRHVSINVGALLHSQMIAEPPPEWSEGVKKLISDVRDNSAMSAIFNNTRLGLKSKGQVFEVGDVLYAGLPGAEPDDKLNFALSIAFAEPEVPEGDPILESLDQLAALVDQVLKTFQKFL